MTTKGMTFDKNGGEPPIGLSHLEIAERLGISRVRVGQIERQAMKKLRALAEAKGLTLPMIVED